MLCAKHPCGIGVDRSIACACELADSVCGVVIATCCCNKLSLDDFRESRVMEFCELNREQLGEVTEAPRLLAPDREDILINHKKDVVNILIFILIGYHL